MKTMGLLGGMSWESTLSYYQILNQEIKDRLGGLHSAEIIMYSVDFAPIEELMGQKNGWQEIAGILTGHCRALEAGGADFIVICTNTMHKVAPEIETALKIPILHIADPTAEAVKKAGFTRVGLLGTSFTMEEDFYRGRLAERHGLEVLTPPAQDRDLVNQVIFNELCLGMVRESSQREYIRIIKDLSEQGAQCVILGCTEIGLLIDQARSPLTLFDTTELHALAAADLALSQESMPG